MAALPGLEEELTVGEGGWARRSYAAPPLPSRSARPRGVAESSLRRAVAGPALGERRRWTGLDLGVGNSPRRRIVGRGAERGEGARRGMRGGVHGGPGGASVRDTVAVPLRGVPGDPGGRWLALGRGPAARVVSRETSTRDARRCPGCPRAGRVRSAFAPGVVRRRSGRSGPMPGAPGGGGGEPAGPDGAHRRVIRKQRLERGWLNERYGPGDPVGAAVRALAARCST